MAKYEDRLIRDIGDETSRGFLWAPRELIDLLKHCRSPWQIRADVLMGQVDLALDRENVALRKAVANEAHRAGFPEGRWVDRNIHPRREGQASKHGSGKPKKERNLAATARRPATRSTTLVPPRKADGATGDLLVTTTPGPKSPAVRCESPMEVGGLDLEVTEEEECQLLGLDPAKIQLPSPAVSPNPLRRSPRKKSPQQGAEEVIQIIPYIPKASFFSSSPARKPARRPKSPTRKLSPAPMRKDLELIPASIPNKAMNRRGRSPTKRGTSSGKRAAHRSLVRGPSPAKRSKPRSFHRMQPSEPKRRRDDDLRLTVYQNTRDPEKQQGEISRGTVNRATVCPVANCGLPLSGEHAFAIHLPGILDETLVPTEELARRRSSLLTMCSSLILGNVNDLEVLAGYLTGLRNIAPGEVTVGHLQSSAIKALCELKGLAIPEAISVSPINCPTAIIHWRVMLLLVACLEGKDREDVAARFPVGPAAGLAHVEQHHLHAIDSHFHLDMTRTKLKKSGASFADICGSVDADPQVMVEGGIAVLCDPDTYPSREDVAQLAESGIGVAIGQHPRSSAQYTEPNFQEFVDRLTYPGVLALGDVGLDYNGRNWSHQHVLLDRVLQHLQPQHVLVLYSRGADDSQKDGCMMQLLYQLKGVVPSQQKIHLHCFGGSQAVVDDWMREFPNTHFGFTTMVDMFDQPCEDSLRQLPDDRVLLETDSPYFTQGRLCSTPALIGMVGAKVARIRQQSWKHVLQVSLDNARRLYGLP